MKQIMECWRSGFKHKNILGILVVLLLASGCSSNWVASDQINPSQTQTASSNPTPTELKTPEVERSNTKLEQRFMAQYKEWKGAPYRLGGESKQGVDCSGFVQVTFQDQLNKSLPRTTAQQVLLGKPVSQNQLKTGDLVFFKTSSKVRHVGIYLSKGRFLHASTSQGVTISYLSNQYWRSKYWTARRPSSLI